MSDFTIGKIVPTTASNAVGKCVHGCPIGTCLACNTPLAKPIEVVSKEKYDAAIARVAELTKAFATREQVLMDSVEAERKQRNAYQEAWTRLEAAHNAALIELSAKENALREIYESHKKGSGCPCDAIANKALESK